MKQRLAVDHIWMALLFAASLAYCVATRSDIFASSVLLTGILCVGLTAIGRKEGYIIGLYTSGAYTWLAYQNGLYGEMLLNVLFFIPTGILGFLMWKRHDHQNVVIMRALSWLERALVAAACVICTAGLGYILSLFATQNTPYIDASTNVLSVIATFLMMWRYKEQWLLYIILNVISVVMWVLRWQAGGVSGDTMVVMWVLYLINSVFGYWRWSIGVRSAAAMEAAT